LDISKQQLIVMLFGHGSIDSGPDVDGFVILESEAIGILPAEFAAVVNEYPDLKLLIFMTSCYSGAGMSNQAGISIGVLQSWQLHHQTMRATLTSSHITTFCDDARPW